MEVGSPRPPRVDIGEVGKLAAFVLPLGVDRY
jgi:hypothetical protein